MPSPFPKVLNCICGYVVALTVVKKMQTNHVAALQLPKPQKAIAAANLSLKLCPHTPPGTQTDTF